jgi:hypothetical protein
MRLALLLLVVGLPGWIALAWWLAAALGRPHWAVEALIYLGLGILWVLPFRALFRGLGRDAPPG